MRTKDTAAKHSPLVDAEKERNNDAAQAYGGWDKVKSIRDEITDTEVVEEGATVVPATQPE